MKNIIAVLAALVIAGMMLLSACDTDNNHIHLLNEKASLPASFKFDHLGLKVMASVANTKQGTMATLFANPLALNCAIKGAKEPAAGGVLALVTWQQQADEHWFGANIPGQLQSVELIETIAGTNGVSILYNKYSGKDLIADPDTLHRQERIKYIFDQQPSVMP